MRQYQVILGILISLLIRASAYAQADHLDTVQAVKASLAGQDLAGPCGAFKITKRVAWELRNSGAGLLYKPTGNNCEERSTDIIAYPDGHIFDILGDGGGANTPMWNDAGFVDANRWRMAVDPGDTPPPPPPPPPSDPLAPVVEQLRVDLVILRQAVEALQTTSEYQDVVGLAQIGMLQAQAESFQRHLDAMNDRITALEARLQTLEALPHYTTCRINVFGIRVGCRLE